MKLLLAADNLILDYGIHINEEEMTPTQRIVEVIKYPLDLGKRTHYLDIYDDEKYIPVKSPEFINLFNI